MARRSLTPMAVLPAAPFGRVLTAMVTPFTGDGGLDIEGVQALAAHLVGNGGNDGLVVNGTTGESATTSDAEKERVVRAAREAVGDGATVLAGVGTNDTAHTIELAQSAEKAGASGLLLVSPYYNRPPQEGLVAHVRAVADATGLPVMLYDIPARTGVAFATETLVRLAEHPRVVAVKDAKDDLVAASEVLRRTDLAFYCGTDALNLPLLSVGAVGVVTVTGHVIGRELATMLRCYDAGDPAGATAVHLATLPIATGMFRTQGVILAKAALRLLGLPAGPVRLPLVDATPSQVEQLVADLAAGGVSVKVPAILG